MNEDRGTPEQQLHDAKRGVSILVTCLVQELEARHPGITESYGERLERAYREVKDEDDNNALDRLELINWTRSLLTGWDMIKGQGKPFLAD